MMLLVHAAPATLARHRRPSLGVLSSPRRFYLDADAHGFRWAADNDAFSRWDARRYRAMLRAITHLSGCLFVTAPDVVGDGASTLERFETYHAELVACGQPIALVAQDGMTPAAIPWAELDALFVGGTTEFKMGADAAAIVTEAKRRRLWVHMGRVNGHQRLRYAKALGCDSIDGTSFSWFRDRWLDEFLAHAEAPAQGLLC